MTFKKKIQQKDFYDNFYQSINFILNLSKTELAILSKFAYATMVSSPRDASPNESAAYAFSSISRKKVAESLGISIFNLNNYIKFLKVKGIIIKRPTSDGVRGIMINPRLLPTCPEEGEEYVTSVKFTIE